MILQQDLALFFVLYVHFSGSHTVGEDMNERSPYCCFVSNTLSSPVRTKMFGKLAASSDGSLR